MTVRVFNFCLKFLDFLKPGMIQAESCRSLLRNKIIPLSHKRNLLNLVDLHFYKHRNAYESENLTFDWLMFLAETSFGRKHNFAFLDSLNCSLSSSRDLLSAQCEE
jgi:hypothetical protein